MSQSDASPPQEEQPSELSGMNSDCDFDESSDRSSDLGEPMPGSGPVQILFTRLKDANPNITDTQMGELLGLKMGDRGLLTRLRTGKRKMSAQRLDQVITRVKQLTGTTLENGDTFKGVNAHRNFGINIDGLNPLVKQQYADSLAPLIRALFKLKEALVEVRNQEDSLVRRFEGKVDVEFMTTPADGNTRDLGDKRPTLVDLPDAVMIGIHAFTLMQLPQELLYAGQSQAVVSAASKRNSLDTSLNRIRLNMANKHVHNIAQNQAAITSELRSSVLQLMEVLGKYDGLEQQFLSAVTAFDEVMTSSTEKLPQQD